MIRIEFRPGNLPANSYAGIHASSGQVLETTYFNLPVRFNVNGIELFEKVSHDSTVFVCQVEQEMLEPTLNLELNSPWISTPLLHLATVGLQQVHTASQGMTAFYHLPGGGHLQFRPQGDSLEIFSSISQRSVLANHTELLKAFEDFKERTRQFLMNVVPELVGHPAWSSWFG